MRTFTLAMAVALLCGCSAESTRIAIESQRRANEVDTAIFDNQHDSLRVLAYRDMLHRVQSAAPRENPADPASPSAELTAGQRSALNEAWNQRDLFEFWRVQHERSRALRMIGVDAKLYGEQSIIDLLYKSLDAKARRIEAGRVPRTESVSEQRSE